MSLDQYVTLGRSGLRISPLCLGTLTFGTQWGYGADENTALGLFDCYAEAGGNFFDTADGYVGGAAEEILGKCIRARKLRDRAVIATKFTMSAEKGNPNAVGNGRKNICRAIENSLRRLGTSYVDLYWMHYWDTVTPVEEVISTLNDLVREGKIRHYGFSDVPAWYAARAQTLAEKEGKERCIALQLEYSLVERSIEREHIPAAQELGMGVCPWAPLAGGFLTGKYKRSGDGGAGEGRLRIKTDTGDPGFARFTERNWRILDELSQVARGLGKTPAQVALNWAATQPGVTSTIVGATSLKQLNDNLGSLEFTIPADLRTRLDCISALEKAHPYVFFGPPFKTAISGGVSVQPWMPARVSGGPTAPDNK